MKIITVLLISIIVLAIVFVFSIDLGWAQVTGGSGGGISGTSGSSGGGGLPNPLGEGLKDPREVIGNIIKAILGIVGSLALAVFIYGGFMWITSAGNEDKIKRGKDMIIWASFGLAVIFASYALVNFVISAVAGT